MNPKTSTILFSICTLVVLVVLPGRAFAPPPEEGSLDWHTYQGGKDRTNSSGINYDWAMGLARDGAGNLYVVGHSTAPWFTGNVPTAPHSPTHPSAVAQTNQDVVVAKFAQDGTLLWHTFLGSPPNWISSYYGWTGEDNGTGIAIDDFGGVVVSGWSDATWGTADGPRLAFGDPYRNKQAFAAKLDAGSGELIWNTFLGAPGWGQTDNGRGIDVDSAGNVYVVGDSYHASWGSPVRPFAGGQMGDAWVAKLLPAGYLDWNTFVGTTNWDQGYAVAVDSFGDIFVTGHSAFTFTDGTFGPLPPVSPVNPPSGGSDAFAAKLDHAGYLQWYTFLGGLYGGGTQDEGFGIDTDDAGNVFVSGTSQSAWPPPPSLLTVDEHRGSGHQAFVAKLDALDGSLLKNTFFEDFNASEIWGFARIAYDVLADVPGSVFVSGESMTGYATGSDAFACELDENLGRQWCHHLFSDIYPTYRYISAENPGGWDCGGSEFGHGIAMGDDGYLYLAGFGNNQCGLSPPNPLNPHTDSGWTDDILLARLYAGEADTDGDGVADDGDNCPATPNTDQADLDGDGAGDACDDDDDGDSVDDGVDNCPGLPNPDQQDIDLDGVGDSCDGDDDDDGVDDGADNCPADWNPTQLDTDGDGIGNACDDDADGDDVIDTSDNCPDVYNPDQADSDGDGAGDACDQGSGQDEDGDGVDDEFDICAGTPGGAVVDPASGCSIEQRCPCSTDFFGEAWKNHGKYVSCVAHASEDVWSAGLISEEEKDLIVAEAARSSCGFTRNPRDN